MSLCLMFWGCILGPQTPGLCSTLRVLGQGVGSISGMGGLSRRGVVLVTSVCDSSPGTVDVLALECHKPWLVHGARLLGGVALGTRRPLLTR